MEGVKDMSATTVIKDILKEKNVSQVELAEKINITKQNLSNKMNRDKFSAVELVEIADVLEMQLTLKDRNVDFADYEESLKQSGKSEELIKKNIDSIKEYYKWLVENNKEYIIDYPSEDKGKAKRNQTEEEKKIAQEKSMKTKAKNAQLQESQSK